MKRKDKSFSFKIKDFLKNPTVKIQEGSMGKYVVVKYKPVFALLNLVSNLRYSFLKGKVKLEIRGRVVENTFALLNIPDDKSSKILDFGATTSTMSLQLASLGYHVTSVDMRPYEFNHPNIRKVVSDVMDMPENRRYDVIIGISTIEHSGMPAYVNRPIPNQDLLIMEKFRKILANKGKIIITVPYGNPKLGSKRHRVYDEKRLVRLAKNFKIETKEYFKRKREGIWITCRSKDLRKDKGLACMVLR